MKISCTINGEARVFDIDPRLPLLHVLREDAGLRGTKYGCGEGECGACTILLNGRTVNSCLTTAGQAHRSEILTIEGVVENEIGRAIVDGFVRTGAVQCGFCTPGFVLSAHALLAQNPAPDVEQIQRALGGNLCRCTGYTKIIEAVATAAEVLERPSENSTPTLMPYMNGAQAYARPATLADALKLLAAPEPGWHVLAGGTDLLTHYEHRLKHLNLLDLSALAVLKGIHSRESDIRIGALTSFTEIAQSPLLQRQAPALVQAAREVGGVQIQNMGTIGGNLVNASPAADSVPPLFTLDARLVLRSIRGERTVPVRALATGPGSTQLAEDELLVEVIVPSNEVVGERVAFFEKVGQRKAQTIAKASVAFDGCILDGRWRQARFALGAVAPTVVLSARATELLTSAPFDEALLTRVAETAAGECSPIDDIRSVADYRRKLVRGLLIRNLWPYLQ